jgi:hypothetical protein
MQTIVTKYHPATNTRAASFTACNSAGSHRVKISDPRQVRSYETREEQEYAGHLAAVEALCKKIGNLWPSSSMVGGTLPGGDMVWVFDDPNSPRTKPRPIFADVSLAEACLGFVVMLDNSGPKDIRGARTVMRAMGRDVIHSRHIRKYAAILDAALAEVK